MAQISWFFKSVSCLKTGDVYSRVEGSPSKDRIYPDPEAACSCMVIVLFYGWLPKLWSLFGSPNY